MINHSNATLTATLLNGGVACIRTDTIYGLVGLASRQETVERIYAIKQRTPTKSPIVLIATVSQMFDQYPDTVYEELLPYWPGRYSIILPSQSGPHWITRGNGSIAYRLPADDALRSLLRTTGPLIAPSANPEGLAPAETIEQAKQYFGDTVDYYSDGGTVSHSTPSSLLRYDTGQFIQLR